MRLLARSAKPVAALTALLFAGPALAGTVTGKVRIIEKKNRRSRDLAQAVVWVHGVQKKPRPARATMTMKRKAFFPRVLVVSVGSTVEFPNADPIFHNVFSVSRGNNFELDLYKRPKRRAWTFKRPGLARIYCNIHPQMAAVILIRDNPYFASAGEDGSFRINDVPPGQYTLKAWHPRGRYASLAITVPARGETGAEVVMDASRFKRRRHKNKYGKEYKSERY